MILGIYCAGNLGREIVDLSRRINKEKRWKKIVFIDEDRPEKKYYDTEIYKLSDFAKVKENIEFVIANGTPENREKLFFKLKNNNYKMTNLIDPTVIISPTAEIEKNSGVIITAYSTISSNAYIGHNVLVQPYVRVPHDAILGRSSVISANVTFGGRVHIGERCFVGLNASIRENIIVEDNAIIGMGAVVVKNIYSCTVNIGNPSKKVRENNKGKIF